MEQETTHDLDHFPAPWGKEVSLKAVDYDSGLKMLRVTIREKNRFTMLDLDVETANHLADQLREWAAKAKAAMDALPPT